MRASVRLVVPVVLPFLASCVQRAELRPVNPVRVEVSGDTARFGPGVTMIEPAGRYVQLELRQRSTVAFLKYSALSGTQLLEVRELAAGVHRLTTKQVGAVAGCSRSCRARQTGAPTLRAPYDALLVVVTIPGRHNDPLRGNNGVYHVLPGRTLYANVALNDLPPSMMRSADQPWAAYLVDMVP